MIGVKEEFYSNLRDEYIKKGTASFLYRYMETEKLKQFSLAKKEATTGKRGDAYLQIKQWEQNFQMGKLSVTEFLCLLLQMLLKGDKLRLKKETRQRVFDLALKIEGDTFFQDCKREVDKYTKIVISLSQHTAIQMKWEAPLLLEVLEQITNELLECALTVDIQTFLYDVGYPVNSTGKINTARKKDRNLDMLTAYCREKKISLCDPKTESIQSLSAEQIAQYEQLYKVLQTSENADVVIPVQIDAVTGAGVYIIGKNNISPKSTVYKRMKGNCCYTCFFVDGLDVEEYNGISSFSWLINDEENTLCNLPDLEEALKWHIYFKADSLEDFRERNGKVPEGCPEELRYLFEETSGVKELLYISEEELNEVKDIFMKAAT